MADEKEAKKDEKAESAGTDELLKARAAAEFLGISERRLHRLRKRGEITAVRQGWRRYAFPTSALMAYVSGVAERMAPAAESSTKEPTTPEAPAPESTREIITKAMGKMWPPPKEPEVIEVEEAPIVRMVNAIFVSSIEAGASDIHFEPSPRGMYIRCRIDGGLRELMMLPLHVIAPTLRRVQVMANMKLASLAGGRAPQVNTILIKHGT